MWTRSFWLVMAGVAMVGPGLSGQEIEKPADAWVMEKGYESLFNGTDLTGWTYLATTPQQKKQRANWQKNDPTAPPWPIYEQAVDFSGQRQSDDGRFVAKAGTLVVTVPPEGRKVQMLYTKREFQDDFTLKLDFRAAPNADSGVFIRGRQLQCRDYPNAGPYQELKKFKPGDWNELVVVVKGQTATCTCNGELLEAKFEVPAKGPIGIEGDRGKLEYRRIRIGPAGKSSAADANLLKPTNLKSSWTMESTGNGKGTMTADGEAMTFQTIETGDENWHVQAYQAGLSLEEGAQYGISFEIQSPEAATVLLQAMINQEDWHGIGLQEQVVAGASFKKHEFAFRATDIVKDNNRIGFVLGNAKGQVSIRNMKLFKR